MRDLEHQIAVALMNWWAVKCRFINLDQRLLFAIPNGGHRAWKQAVRLKAEGVRAGVPDYFLAVSRESSPGLFLELKADGGRLSEAQKEMAAILTAQGYPVVTAKGIDEAIRALELYLECANVSRGTS